MTSRSHSQPPSLASFWHHRLDWTPLATLQHIASRLQAMSPTDLIEELAACTRSDAVAWVRRLPLWEEHRGQVPDQTVGIARTVSRRAMREFRLEISDDGQVADCGSRPPGKPSAPTLAFTLSVAGEEVQVSYTRDYCPRGGSDNFSFVAERNPLSASGHWHTFAPGDAVQAVGGPQAFARLYAEAKLAGRDQEFLERFEGKMPEQKRPVRKQRAQPEQPVVGQHTAAVTEERAAKVKEAETEEKPVVQGDLF